MAKTEEGKRVTITFTNAEWHDKIVALARKHKLSQGEVIEVLLDTVHDEHFLIEGLVKKRKDKVAGRTSIRAIIERTKGERASKPAPKPLTRLKLTEKAELQ